MSDERFDGTYAEQARSLPRTISVDDHVLEPPDLWTSRLPKKYLDRGPRVVRERGQFAGVVDMHWTRDDDGVVADVWYYDDVVKPLGKLFAAAGFDKKSLDWEVVTFDDVRPGSWRQKERLADMDLNHTDASVCFPNTLPRFCGQTFLERDDKDLALLCVQAYNDWMIDEWCAGDAKGRIIPLTLVPLWDVQLAIDEVRRCADKGSHAIAFTENPPALGLPTLYSGAWDPFYMTQVYGCIVDDETGLANRDRVGMDQICFETDYPHAESMFPHSAEVVVELAIGAGLNDDEIYKFLRGNAINAFGLQ